MIFNMEYTQENLEKIKDIVLNTKSIEKRVEILQDAGFDVCSYFMGSGGVLQTKRLRKETRVQISSGMGRNNKAYCIRFDNYRINKVKLVYSIEKALNMLYKNNSKVSIYYAGFGEICSKIHSVGSYSDTHLHRLLTIDSWGEDLMNKKEMRKERLELRRWYQSIFYDQNPKFELL